MSFEKKRMFYKDPVTGQEKPFHPETDAGVVKVGESTLDVELAALKQPATQSCPRPDVRSRQDEARRAPNLHPSRLWSERRDV